MDDNSIQPAMIHNPLPQRGEKTRVTASKGPDKISASRRNACQSRKKSRLTSDTRSSVRPALCPTRRQVFFPAAANTPGCVLKPGTCVRQLPICPLGMAPRSLAAAIIPIFATPTFFFLSLFLLLLGLARSR